MNTITTTNQTEAYRPRSNQGITSQYSVGPNGAADPNRTPYLNRNPGPTYSTDGNGSNLDQIRYWVGAALTAAIAAMAGIVGLIIAHGIVHIPVLMTSGDRLTPIHTAVYALAAAGIALVAAGLYDAMLHIAPRPATYYGCLASMVTLLAMLVPFTSAASLHSQVALAATNLAVGLIITLLVPIAATNAQRNPNRAERI